MFTKNNKHLDKEFRHEVSSMKITKFLTDAPNLLTLTAGTAT
jgi:hypothetical protein